MTRVTVDFHNESRLELLLAFLRRLGAAEVEVAVEREGRRVELTSSPDDDARFEALVDHVIEDAMAGKMEAFTPREEEREESELAEYGEARARELGGFTDDEIVRMINEDRKERRERIAA